MKLRSFTHYLAVVLLLSFGGLTATAVSSQSSADLRFEVTPVAPARLTLKTNSSYPEYPHMFVDYFLELSASANFGPINFIVSNLVTGESQSLPSISGASGSVQFNTLHMGMDDQPLEFCASVGSEKLCTSLLPTIGRGCVPIGEGGLGCPDDFPDWEGSLVYYTPQTIDISQSQCGTGPDVNFWDAGYGMVTPGSPNNVRSAAGSSNSQVGQIPAGAMFQITNGTPICNAGLQWWQVNYNGVTGWMAVGDDTGYWAYPVVMSAQNREISLNIYSPGLEHTYHFVIDPETCFIINGAEVIVEEVNRFNEWLATFPRARGTAESFFYFRPTTGTIDTFRIQLERELQTPTGCSELEYLVGVRPMDLSGPGNIMFGYFTLYWPDLLQWLIENGAQITKNESEGQMNPQDDVEQRLMGEYLAQQLIGGEPLTIEMVEGAAYLFLNTRSS